MNAENSSEEEQAMNNLVEIFCDVDDFCRFFIPQIEHSRHRSIKGFLLTVLGGVIVYSLKLKKPSLKNFYSEDDFPVMA
ncbi:hypothetical protein MEG1DRAFT_03572 [Photorhabdus temperata subsp. temperata Meg1]|uniref:Transposase n=2 Tax=Photorhabdus temperata TaxID=574560 RepID=A0A081RSY4_PHOTE|nr:hypothetical protein MEG1DRAFT_03572 [Photorhabdus temperata subsp. temperata Meg1]